MRVIGHRGAAHRVTENTVAAVTWALDHHADGVELDVRRTADGALVLSHDPSLARHGGPELPVVALTLADVAGVRLAGGLPVATVEQALDAALGRGQVVLEVKNIPGEPDFDAPAEATAELLVRLLAERRDAGVHDDAVVSSFDWFAIERVRTLRPDLPTAFLLPPGIDLHSGVVYAAEHGHPQVHPHASSVLAEPRSVRGAHAAGLAVVCWTVDDPAEARQLADAGVDAVISNDPAALLAALA